jgi:glycosyltransferase involved in cell wall biosynthesis
LGYKKKLYQLGINGVDMRKKVVVRGPALTQSGYGEHTRFLLRSLKKFPEKFDIYLVSVNWGQTGWLSENSEEREWLDSLILKTHEHTQSGGHFDMSVQVSIPNEWEPLAPYNVGVTAGIETTKVAPIWLERANMMDKVITISEHSKNVFEETAYHGFHRDTQQPMALKCETPIDIVHYPVKNQTTENIELDLEHDFNYLMVSQWGPRKNMANALKWWLEENYDEDVGLILKTSLKNNSIMDRIHILKDLRRLISDTLNEDAKCKVYLLHGDMSEAQMQSLYSHPKIKALINLSHGEGFGLPIFDAVCHGVPVIAPGWSGHCDFLYKTDKKGKKKALFADVNYDINPIQDFAVWDGVVQKDSMWCYPHEGHYKMRLRQVRKGYDKWLKKAKSLQEWVLKEFESEKQHDLFADTVYGEEVDIGSWLQELNESIVEYE